MNKFDSEHWAEEEFRLELFCVLCSGIERNAIGGTLKDYLISLAIVRDALDYITVSCFFLLSELDPSKPRKTLYTLVGIN